MDSSAKYFGDSFILHLKNLLALVGALMLKPRIGYKKQRERIVMDNASAALSGLFMIWWGTQAINGGR